MFPRHSVSLSTGFVLPSCGSFVEPYAAYIDRDVAQILLKVLKYLHRCHISLRHSSHSLLKKHRPNYCYSHELPYQFYWGNRVAQYFSPPLTSRPLAIVFTGSGISVKNGDVLLKRSRIGQNEMQICILNHFLHSVRKTCYFGFTCPLNPVLPPGQCKFESRPYECTTGTNGCCRKWTT